MGNSLKAVSLFSGCGGFDWGAQEAGVEVVWANDIDPHAAAAYKGLFPNVEFRQGDIKSIKTFPQADVLIGCYPCTGFSEAARRRSVGMEEKRDLKKNAGNFLYTEFLRALKIVRPKYLFVENVQGMKSAAHGWFLEQQLSGFEESGYDVCPNLLVASEFGIAQRRKRIFIAGVQKDVAESFSYQFPRPTHGPNTAHDYCVLEDVLAGMEEWPEGEFSTAPFHGHYLTRNRKRGWKELSYTIVAHADHVPLHPIGEPMRNVGKDKWELQGEKNRRFSWRECAAIQGLPTKVAPSGNLAQKYRVIGNAVPPAFGKALLEPIVEFESGIADKG